MKKKVLLFYILLIAVLPAKSQHYKVIAYYTGDGETIRQYPVEKLTHIIYSFLKLQNDTLAFYDDSQKQTIEQLVALKKDHPQLKIMVSVGGWGGCAACSELFSSPAHRITFAQTAIALFKKYNIDGLDLDWEYPAIEGYPGHQYTAADKDNFTALIKELRSAMGSAYQLSFAAGGFTNYLEQSVDWNNVTPLVDFINLMTYDLVGGYSTVTGHHTPLASYKPDQQSVQKCVNWLLNKKVAADKLIIGAAFYARVWENVADSNHGLYQAGTFKESVAYKNFSSYFSDTSGFVYYRDIKAKAPYQYNLQNHLFATFDDAWSTGEKAKFVRKKKLGGIMFWELTEDDSKNKLLDTIYRMLYN